MASSWRWQTWRWYEILVLFVSNVLALVCRCHNFFIPIIILRHAYKSIIIASWCATSNRFWISLENEESGGKTSHTWFFILFEILPFIADFAVQVKIPMTATEKILANASEQTNLVPRENVWAKADVLMTHDVSGPGVFGVFKKEFGENAKVCAPCLWMEALVRNLAKK